MDEPQTLPADLDEILADHPGWVRHLEEMVAWEEDHPPQLPDGSDSWRRAWTWKEVHTPVAVCNGLVGRGLVDVAYESRSTTDYRLHDHAAVREALEMLRDGTAPRPAERPASADGLFTLVVGHERAKVVLAAAVQADSPVHVLLWGPPGAAKTLLLSDIARLPGAELYAGSTTTKAGLVGLLLAKRPRYLILDELDKMGTSDMTPLLNLMEGGYVMVLQFKRQERIQLDTKVFATANDLAKIPAPNLSRFAKVEIPPYSRAEFVEVATAVLQRREGCGALLAALIAREVAPHSLDIRDAQRVARLVKGDSLRVVPLVATLFPAARVSQLKTVPRGDR